ncbi:hypothetical protein [Marinobacter sp. AN1]|uniref:hypothetical protein n=1 Tax=Marinobacter sp. AN1 TaxID=2886046 RepID=UPI00222E3831|nr:hypothetical protein [Marinobacter sp. AN1]UZD66516.1 hypothetical protein LJ360_03985 [Marinobacter sp. AN1]
MLRQNSFVVSISDTRPENAAGACYSDDRVQVKMEAPNEHYIVFKEMGGAGFSMFFGERKDDQALDFTRPINGTSIIYEADNKTLKVVADEVGAEHLYYRIEPGSILLSNRLDNLVREEDEPDWTAIQCFLTHGYTLKTRTFFKDVKQTRPYQTLSVEVDGPDISEAYYAPQDTSGLNKDEAEIISSFSHRFSEILESYPSMVLMMSAGWDSRTILAPETAPVAAAYTHGDLSSRETTIAKKLTGQVRKDHLFTDIRNLEINNRLLDEIMEINGHCLWPIWHISSRLIARAYNLPITSGVIGARVGGHNGFPSMGNRWQKVINSLHLLSPALISKDKITRDLRNALTIPETFWFTSKAGHELFTGTRRQTTQQLHDALDEYMEDNEDFATAIEKFNFEHVSRQYMMKQPAMARGSIGYYSPLSHPDLLNLAYAIPFRSRLHNKVSQKVIRQLNPALLDFPMAATLAKARRSILVQELSRILRILIERTSEALHRNKPRLGWFNYEHLYTQDVFPEIIDSLTSDLWSKERMKEVIARNPARGIDAGSTLDMLCKIKTVDYYLNLRSNRE